MALIFGSTQLVLNAYAVLVNETPGNNALNEHKEYIAANGEAAYKAALNSVFAGKTTAQLATDMLANLGLTNAWVGAQADAEAFLAANASNRVGAMMELAQKLYDYSGTDAALVAASSAYKADIAGSYAYSIDSGNAAGKSLTGSDTGGQPIYLTASTDILSGTAGADSFVAYLSQNSTAGGVSNTLSSADRLSGGAGADSLFAELVPEFFGSTGNNQVDVQAKISGIETIEFEARDSGSNDGKVNVLVTVDAKYITGVDSIGSKFSDGDLIIENLTTLTDAGVARNTQAITITMDHTDDFNSDEDASDLTVYFDEDYLLAGQTAQAQAFYFLLDEAAELAGNSNRLARIDVDGIRFTLAGSTTVHELQSPAAQTAGTHAGFVAALQADLAAKIASGELPAGTTLTVSTIRTDTTGLDNGTLSAPIPAILLTIGDGTKVTPVGYSRVEELIGAYDVYGQFNADSSVAALPVTVNIDLNKVGREGEGGNLIIGGKELDSDGGRDNEGKGITVFNVDVLGDSTKPSNLGTLDSTNGDLETINIKTHADYVAGTSFASLSIRDGFGNAGNKVIPGQVNLDNDLKLVNANEFKGDLTLGEDIAVLNLDTLNATGGGKIDFTALIDGKEKDQAYSYTTGAAADKVSVTIAGSAVDFAKSSVNVLTGAGDDAVNITTAMVDAQGNQVLNQVILKNIAVDTGADNDTVTLVAGSQGDVTINTGTGDDVVYTSAGVASAVWAFNYDDARTGVTSLGSTAATNLPGVQTSLAFLSGATVRVTLSGAGLAALDGGVMAVNDIDANGNVLADDFADGYEASTAISTLINGNQYFGDQRDINAAIVKIITENATLNKLLVAKVSTDNTLVITSLTGGAFNTDDLEITLTQKTASTTSQPAFAAAVLAEAEVVFKNSLLTMTDLWGSEAPTEAATYVGENDGAGAIGNDVTVALNPELDAYYTGLGVDNATLHTAGVSSTLETDTIINGGLGNDVIVLSTDAVFNAVPAYTLGVNNRLLNGASNETIKLGDSTSSTLFGNDVVMNFTANAALPGVDFLDYGYQLTSKVSASGSTASTKLIPVTLAADVAGVLANEVSVIRFDNTDAADATETFTNLSATQIAALFNFKAGDKLGTNTQFGNLLSGTFSVKTDYDDANTAGSPKIDLVSGAGKSVVMVENADNLGLYKVFELSWYGGVTDAASTHTVTAVDLGSLDFGTSLAGMTDISLIGSAANKALTLNGGGVPPAPAPAVTAIAPVAATVTEGNSAVFNITGTNLVAGMTFTLGGTATAADYGTGVLAVASATSATFTLPIVTDAVAETGETVTLAYGATTSTAVTLNDIGVGRTEVNLTDASLITNAATGAFEYNIPLTGLALIANVGVFGADDAFDVDNAFINNANLLFGTTGTTQISMVVGDLTDFNPSFVVNITTDATVVADVAAAVAAGANDLADTAAVIGVLNAAWGTDWLV